MFAAGLSKTHNLHVQKKSFNMVDNQIGSLVIERGVLAANPPNHLKLRGIFSILTWSYNSPDWMKNYKNLTIVLGTYF